jgi:hypothetical protein
MRFNPNTYDPAVDSSPGTKSGSKTLRLVFPTETACKCGCGKQPTRPTSRFIQGHDARLKGALTRAALTNTKVEALVEGKPAALVTATAFAKQHGFGDTVAASVARAKVTPTKPPAAARQKVARAQKRARKTDGVKDRGKAPKRTRKATAPSA